MYYTDKLRAGGDDVKALSGSVQRRGSNGRVEQGGGGVEDGAWVWVPFCLGAVGNLVLPAGVSVAELVTVTFCLSLSLPFHPCLPNRYFVFALVSLSRCR